MPYGCLLPALSLTSVGDLCYDRDMVILTPKQTMFCEHYIQTNNGTLSSRLAGYKGASDNIHAVNASRLLRNPKIRDYLSERYKTLAMGSDEVLMRLANIARASLGDFCDEHGTIDWKKVANAGYPIKSFKRGNKIEFESKLRALELIGKAHAMFTEKIEFVDWREELRKHDVEPSKIFEEYVKQFMEVQSAD